MLLATRPLAAAPYAQRYTQLVSLRSFRGRDLRHAAPQQRSATSRAATATSTGSVPSLPPPPPPLSSAPPHLHGLRRRLQHSSHHRHGRSSRQWSGTVCASVLQAPVHHMTLTQLSARFLGYAVLVGSCFRSTPQIMRIIKADSAAGVSMFASIAELVAYSITCAYNLRLGYAFSTYGEVAACWAQDIVLIALISRHARSGHKRLGLFAAGFAVYCWWLLSPACTVSTLRVLQASTISMIALGGRLPQIVLNIRRGDSGELSITTSALNLAGNMARAFTTLVLTKDALLLLANAVQGCLNSVLLYQTVMTAVRRRADRRRRLILREDDDMPNDDEEDAEVSMSPTAIEAAEDEEAAEEGADSAAAAASAVIGDVADAGMIGDGGGFGSSGGGGSMMLEPPPGEFMDLAGGGGGGGPGTVD